MDLRKPISFLLMIIFLLFVCNCSDNNNGDDNGNPTLLGPYQVDFDEYSYVVFLFCEMFVDGDDGILIMPSGNSPDSLDVNDVHLQINGEDIEVGQFLHVVAAVYQFIDGEFYNFALNINGEISSGVLQRPYSVDISFPDSLDLGNEYLIDWIIQNDNSNQGFITDTDITYQTLINKNYEHYDELVYFELNPSAREFLYHDSWLDSLEIDEGHISLALSQWNCDHNNNVYFVSEYYCEENYIFTGAKKKIDQRNTVSKILDRINRFYK